MSPPPYTALSFADDTRITMKVRQPEDYKRLQEDLNVIYKWADTNNMMFNASKFEHLRYGAVPSTNQEYYKTSNGSEIKTEASVRDLGVTMSNQGGFSEHIDCIALRAKRLSGWIMRTFMTRKKLDIFTLYMALVLPIMEYCCQLWSPLAIGQVRKLETVQ